MRVLFLCHRFLDTQIGGLSEFLHHLPNTLRSHGIESVIYTQNENESQELSGPIVLKNGVHCYQGPFIKPSFFSPSKKLNPLLTLCKNQKIDLIHAQGVYRSGYMAMRASKKSGIPFVVTSHSDLLSVGSKRMRRGKVQNRCASILKNAHHVTHLTPMMAKVAHDIYDTQPKSTIIGNGIDLAAWQPYLNSPTKNYALAIGRLVPEKGFHILIDALAQLKNDSQKISLMIAGSGAEEANLQNQAKSLGLNVITQFNTDQEIPEQSVIFTGYINTETKMRLMSQAKIVLFAPQPSIWEEPYGIVQLEAMVAGKPFIASDTAAVRFLQQHGLQVKTVVADDPADWKRMIQAVLDDSELQKQMGMLNQDNSKQFDWDIVAKQYAEAYISTIKG